MQQAAKALEQAVKRYAQQDPVCQRLLQVPGVGPLVASTSVATLDDPTRFATSTRVAAYLGSVPRVHKVGEAQYHRRISKEGDKLLRWLLVEVAHLLLTRTKRSSTLKRWGLKLAKKGRQGKANVVVARKLVLLLHRLWVRDATFTPGAELRQLACASSRKKARCEVEQVRGGGDLVACSRFRVRPRIRPHSVASGDHVEKHEPCALAHTGSNKILGKG